MPSNPRPLVSLDQIRLYVTQLLCEKDKLEPDSFNISESPLRRDGMLCGMLFHLQGPRAVCLSAVWDANTATLLCYGSRGERFAEIRLDRLPTQ